MSGDEAEIKETSSGSHQHARQQKSISLERAERPMRMPPKASTPVATNFDSALARRFCAMKVLHALSQGFGLEEQHWHADEMTDLIRSAPVE